MPKRPAAGCVDDGFETVINKRGSSLSDFNRPTYYAMYGGHYTIRVAMPNPKIGDSLSFGMVIAGCNV